MSRRLAKIELLLSGFLIGFGAATIYTMWSGWSNNPQWAVAYNLYGEGPRELALTLAFVLLGVLAAVKAALLMRLQDDRTAARAPPPEHGSSSFAARRAAPSESSEAAYGGGGRM